METLTKLVVHSHPPPPSPPPINLPSLFDFVGLICYMLCFVSGLNDAFDNDDLTHIMRFESFEYSSFPVYNIVGFLFGTTAYLTSYLKYSTNNWLHLFIIALAVFFFVRHQARTAELSKRAQSTLSLFAVLPLICIFAIERKHVAVNDLRAFYFMQIVLSIIPLPFLIKVFKNNAYNAQLSKPKKKIFGIFFINFLLIASISRAENEHHLSNDILSARIFTYDMALLILCADLL